MNSFLRETSCAPIDSLRRQFAMESVLSPLKTCSKIGISSTLFLSLFADREGFQIFLSFKVE